MSKEVQAQLLPVNQAQCGVSNTIQCSLTIMVESPLEILFQLYCDFHTPTDTLWLQNTVQSCPYMIQMYASVPSQSIKEVKIVLHFSSASSSDSSSLSDLSSSLSPPSSSSEEPSSSFSTAGIFSTISSSASSLTTIDFLLSRRDGVQTGVVSWSGREEHIRSF